MRLPRLQNLESRAGFVVKGLSRSAQGDAGCAHGWSCARVGTGLRPGVPNSKTERELMDWSSTANRGRRCLVLGFVCVVFAGLVAAPAIAAEQAFVDGNGVVQVVGDAGNDDIHFSDGGHPPNGHD